MVIRVGTMFPSVFLTCSEKIKPTSKDVFLNEEHVGNFTRRVRRMKIGIYEEKYTRRVFGIR